MQHQAFYPAVFDSVLEVIVWLVQVLITPHAENNWNFKVFFIIILMEIYGKLWFTFLPVCDVLPD